MDEVWRSQLIKIFHKVWHVHIKDNISYTKDPCIISPTHDIIVQKMYEMNITS